MFSRSNDWRHVPELWALILAVLTLSKKEAKTSHAQVQQAWWDGGGVSSVRDRWESPANGLTGGGPIARVPGRGC
jgi:hypothetical protein